MILADRMYGDRQHAFEQFAGFREFSLCAVDESQIVEIDDHVGKSGARLVFLFGREGSLFDVNHALQQLFSLGVAAHVLINGGKIREQDDDFGIPGAILLLRIRQCVARIGQRGFALAIGIKRAGPHRPRRFGAIIGARRVR